MSSTCNKQFLFFPMVFPIFLVNFLPFSSDMKLSSAKSLSLEESKDLLAGNGLTNFIFQLLGNSENSCCEYYDWLQKPCC